MVTMTVTTGTGFRPVTLTITGNFQPTYNEVFAACNRNGDLDTDLAALPTGWQRTLRTLLDHHQAASMSEGDTIDIIERK